MSVVTDAIETMEAAKQEILTLRGMREDLLATLEEVRGLIDGYVDVVDGDYGCPEPNNAMRARFLIDQAFSRVEGMGI